MNKPDAVDLSLDAEDTGRADWERDFRELLAFSRGGAEEVVATLECRNRSVRTTPPWELSDAELVDAALLARDVARIHREKRKRQPRKTSSEDCGSVAPTTQQGDAMSLAFNDLLFNALRGAEIVAAVDPYTVDDQDGLIWGEPDDGVEAPIVIPNFSATTGSKKTTRTLVFTNQGRGTMVIRGGQGVTIRGMRELRVGPGQTAVITSRPTAVPASQTEYGLISPTLPPPTPTP